MRAPLRFFVAPLLFLWATEVLRAQPADQAPDGQSTIPRVAPTIVEAAPPSATSTPPSTETPPSDTDAPSASGPTSRGDSLLGVTSSASQGVYGRADLETRPMFGPTSVLDAIPGFASTQENSGNDASVYYVRGVNAAHGTDFAIFVDGMPVNEPTHAHAQGFADINFLIPELVEVVDYRKGSYYADLGDFSTLGSAKMRLFRTLPQSVNLLSAGQYAWVRGVRANSGRLGDGDLLYAVDLSFFDNGFEVAEKNKRFKGLLKYTAGDDCEGSSVSLMAYHSDWFSTEAQPLRAIQSGLIGRYGSLDPTTGGRGSRFSLNKEYWREDEYGEWRANAYTIYNRFDIFINPDAVPEGQVHQPDGRLTSGLNLARTFELELIPLPSPWTIGVQMRNDFVNRLRSEQTLHREVVAVDSNHRVNVFTVSPYLSNETRWTDWARTVAGVRGDIYEFDVTNLVDRSQSGDKAVGLACPKFSMILGPWLDTEYFLNMGTGFHSNDARGLFDPLTPTNALARTKSAEVGLRSETFDNWTTSVAVWYQKFASELVFDAEEGTTVARGASRRYGVEWTNTFRMGQWLTWDVDWAWANVRFLQFDPDSAGFRIPLSLSSILSTGPTVRLDNGFYSTLRFRSFSPRPLALDDNGNLVQSGSLNLGNLEVGWKRDQWQLAADVFNVFGSRSAAEAFFFPSQLPGEPAPVSDFHIHPLDPTQVRFTVTRYY